MKQTIFVIVSLCLTASCQVFDRLLKKEAPSKTVAAVPAAMPVVAEDTVIVAPNTAPAATEDTLYVVVNDSAIIAVPVIVPAVAGRVVFFDPESTPAVEQNTIVKDTLVPAPKRGKRDEIERREKEAKETKETIVATPKPAPTSDGAVNAPKSTDTKFSFRQKNQIPAPSPLEITIGGYKVRGIMLNIDQKKQLDNEIKLLNEQPDVQIICIGHTCDVGNDKKNLSVGFARANLVREYLIQHDISPDRITTKSWGQYKPLVPNNSEKNREKNRRVEIKVIYNL